MRKRIIIIIAFLLTSSFVLFGGFRLLNNTSNTRDIKFSINQGDSLKDISIRLKENDIINSSEYMVILAKLKNIESKLQVGEYTIKPNTRIEDLLEQFQDPDIEYVRVTIPEGYTFYQIANKLEEHQLVNKDKFLSMNQGILPKEIESEESKDVLYPLEGYLFPDTYFFNVNAREEEIIKTMYNKFSSILSDEYKKRARELNYSINEIVTIASLIEREAYNDEERRRISGVIYNRLEAKMPLQIDASVIYGITSGRENIERLFYKDLEVESKYNTYLYKGLPPGPISSPGEVSIEAALYPEDHNYLYYVLGDNGHVFSETYEEHLENKRKYIK